MEILETIIKKILDKGVITQKEKLTSSTYKIQIKSDSVKKINFVPGCFLRLGVGIGKDNTDKKDKVRSYTIWDINKKNNTIDIAVATHSNGIGAKWVKDCKVGDVIYFKTKRGKFIVDNSADSYLMIGDLSALSHLYMINRNLTEDKQVSSLIYSENINDLYVDIDGKKPFDFYDIKPNNSDKIISKIQAVIPKLKGEKMVYIAGDSRICIKLNHYFKKELNWNTKQIKTKPFWNPDKKGLE